MFKRISSSRRKKPVEDNNNDSKVSRQEDLPQVWLAVQTGQDLEEIGSQANLQMENQSIQPTAAAAPKPKKKVIIKDHTQELSTDSDTFLIPQDVTAIGWGDEEELDYSKIQSPSAPSSIPASSGRGLPVLSVIDQYPPEGDNTRQRRPSGVSSVGSVFSYAQSSSFQVYCLGKMSSVSNDWIAESSPHTILKIVEMAQRHGDIPWQAELSTEQRRMLIVSKYGVKVTDDKKQRVFGRFALHNIVNVIHYTSIYGGALIVLRTINEGHRDTVHECDLHVYECQNNDQANDVCVTLGQAFDTVMNKMKMDENLHGPLI